MITLPDFDTGRIVNRTVKGGLWSDTGIWDMGHMPRTGDAVHVEHEVIYDVDSKERLHAVHVDVGGWLSFLTNAYTSLWVQHFVVHADGTVVAGWSQDPVSFSTTIVILNEPLEPHDREQIGNGLIVCDRGKWMSHGWPKTPYARLAREPQNGHVRLYFEKPVQSWNPGDSLVIPDSHQLDWHEQHSNKGAYLPQWEQISVKSVSDDGKEVELVVPLVYPHRGARDLNGKLEFLPHVMNLKRSVVIRSENAREVRGHCIFMDRAYVDIRYTQFGGLGRTTNESAGPGNQQGRYPVHFHHLYGPSPGDASVEGYQYLAIGNAISCPVNGHNRRWGMAIHDSHYGLIHGNCFYNWAGAALVTEDGNETGNTIAENFVCRVDGTGERGTWGRGGDGFWFRGPNNYVRDNIATNCYGGGNSWGYQYNLERLGWCKIPQAQGEAPSEDTFMNSKPMLEFARNECYGATPGGFTQWHLGATFNRAVGSAGVCKDFRCWHVYEAAYLHYDSNDLTIDGLVVRGDARISSSDNWLKTGLTFGDYYARDFKMVNCDIQGCKIGFDQPGNVDGELVIKDSYFRNRWNIGWGTMWTVSGGLGIPSKKLVVDNCRFDAPSGMPLIAIYLAYNWGSGRNLIQSDSVYVTAYQGHVGDNFRVYYHQQASDFIVPQTGEQSGDPNRPVIGSPEKGLTNRQNWDRHGICIAGAIAPDATVTRPEIDGLVEVLP